MSCLHTHTLRGHHRMQQTVPQHHSRNILPARGRSRGSCSSAADAAASAQVLQQAPPRMQSKVRLDKLYLDTHQEMCQRDLRVMHVKSPLLFTDAFYFRHPDDVWAILNKDDVLFGKSSRVTATKEWLGQGIFSQLDPDKHTAARATLNPAFRRDYVARLDSFMVASAQQLAALLSGASTDPAGQGQAVDMQRLFRLMAIDTIGLTSLNRSFDALRAWQQQQHGLTHASSSGKSSSSSSPSDGQLELERRLLDLNAAFLLQSLQLPIPRSWLPGWSKYVTACQQLDDLINSILQDTRAQMQQQEQLGTASNSSNSSSSRQTLVSFLLAAQQQQGADKISDQQILDEIKTVLFGGTDTSAFTLAMCAYYLAQHPEAADRAAAEVQALLQQGGRDVLQLTAEDVNKMPWLVACVNETMRLAPAGPVITRTALQDTELAGFSIPKGKTVAGNIFAMHRHPNIWPQPDAWLPQRWLPAEAAAAGLSTQSSSKDGSSKSQQPFLPFSTGPRGCIGRNYALLQMVLALAVLLGYGIRFALKGGPQPDLVKSMTMHAQQGVWLVPCSCRQ